MLKNRIFTALAFAGLVGFTACADEPEVVEEPVVEEPIMEPATEPVEPIVTDTMMADTALEADTLEM